MDLGMGEIVVVLLIILLLFGPTKVPQLGESLGKAIRGFRDAMRSDPTPVKPPPANPPPASAPQLPPATPRPDMQAPSPGPHDARTAVESTPPRDADTDRPS